MIAQIYKATRDFFLNEAFFLDRCSHHPAILNYSCADWWCGKSIYAMSKKELQKAFIEKTKSDDESITRYFETIIRLERVLEDYEQKYKTKEND